MGDCVGGQQVELSARGGGSWDLSQPPACVPLTADTASAGPRPSLLWGGLSLLPGLTVLEPDPGDSILSQLYQALNFRVVLVGLEIWNDGDKIKVSPQADTTLDNFLVWRAQDLVRRQVHDNAQLIT